MNPHIAAQDVGVRLATEADATALAPLLATLGYPTTASLVAGRLARLAAFGGSAVALVAARDGDVVGLVTAHAFIAHNTVISPTNSAFVFGPLGTQQLGFTARDNVIGGGAYGMTGDNFGGAAAFAKYAPGGVFVGNVMILASGSAAFPAGNFYPPTVSALGFAYVAAEDYRLLASSPFKGQATDGRDPGADIDANDAAIKGVRTP